MENEFFEIVDKEGNDVLKEEEKSQEVKALVVAKKKQPAPLPQMITFDRYFLSLGRPMHHKAGMAAYLKNVKGKKTREAWDTLYKDY